MKCWGGVYVVGTDTEVGKTYQSCGLIRALVQRGVRVGVYKPVASGFALSDRASDPMQLRTAAGLDWPVERICPQNFAAALAPPVAAAAEQKTVDPELLVEGFRWWQTRCEFLVVEGVGGLLSPVSSTHTGLDLARLFSLPTLLVAANRLGAVNHTLLTLDVLQHADIVPVGVVLNPMPQLGPDPSASSNRQLLAAFTEVSIVDSAAEYCETLLAPRGS